MSKKKETDILFRSSLDDVKDAKFFPDIEGFTEGQLQIEPEWFPGTEDFFCVDHFPSILNCTEAEYHQIQAFSNSFASTLLIEDPWFQKAWTGIEPSRPMILGSAAELYIELLSDCIKDQSFTGLDQMNWKVGKVFEHVVVMPLWEGTGARKNQQAFRKDHQDKLIITEKEFDTIMLMLKSALSNSQFWERLNGTWQTVILWIEDGIPMKAMLDHITQNLLTRNIKTPGDLKTTDVGNPRAFHKKMYDRNYDMQAYHYTVALQSLYPDEKIGNFIWYVLETQDPYGSAVYYADEVVLESGRAKRARAIEIAKQLYKNGELAEFPNYSPAYPKEFTLWDWQINKSLRMEQENEILN
jgi:hypothetical protein